MNKLTDKQVGKEYHKHSYDIAVMLSKLKDKKDRFEWLMQNSNDNGDPFFDAEQTLREMGYLLSTLVI